MVPTTAFALNSTARCARGRSSILAACGLALGLLAGCSGGGSGGAPATDSVPNGSVAQHPDSNPQAPTFFIGEDPTSGDASSLVLLESYWGRLVQVFDVDGLSPVFSNFVVDDQIVGDGLNYQLERDPLTDVERIRILYQQDTPEFYNAVLGLEGNLQVVLKKGISPSELPPFTAVARNAALVLRFNDLLDESTINSEALRVLSGYAPSQPFEARIFPDPSHGNLVEGQFHSTRVIIDFTVSELEASGTSLPLNAIGLPEASNTSQPNMLIRIPSQPSPANQQFVVLRTLGGRAISFTGNGPTDPLSPTLDVLRSFRAGGATEVTGDPNNGFLVDVTPPVVVGRQTIDLMQTVNFQLGLTQPATIRFHTPVCAFAPQVGDVIEVNAIQMQVLQAPSGSPNNGVVGPFLVRPLCDACDPPVIIVNTNNPPAGVIRAPYRTPPVGADPDYPACFVKFLPSPSVLPATGVPLDATISVSFSEPIDPASVRPFDTMVLNYANNAPNNSPLYESVVGNVLPAQDRRTYTFQPVLPLRKVLPGGAADQYTLSVSAGAAQVRDLAGNSLGLQLPPATFTLATTGPTFDSAGIHLKFDSTDEDLDGEPEIRGQFLYDIAREVVKPRAVNRFSAVVDRTVASVGAMVDLPATNIVTPLSNYGSRLMRVWRYHDVAGFSLRDESTHNMDVENLWWQPFGGALQIDNFQNFEMQVAHSRFLPDEVLDGGLLPMFTTSGLIQNFANNQLDPVTDPLTVIHPRARGYQVNPNDLTTSSSGNVIAPFPMNRSIAPDQFVYWTWRDTSKLKLGGPSGSGADTSRLAQVVGTAAVDKGFYPTNKVPTIGLPMLLEFRTYPDTQAAGQNGFRIAIAINSSARPYFRAFSTGGVVGTNTEEIQPDSEVLAGGGINPNPGPGMPVNTWWGDNTFYYGQADFLVRISRVHTSWMDTLASATIYSDVLIEPSPDSQPTGTQLIVSFRGASGFTPNVPNPPFPYHDASNMDAYGDLYTSAQLGVVKPGSGIQATNPIFSPTPTTDNSWRSTASAINGARYFQARITFLSNPLSGLSPELSALGFAYRH